MDRIRDTVTKTFRPSSRGYDHTQQSVDMMKSARAGTLKKDFPNQPSQAEIEQLVENQNTDLVLRALAPILDAKYKQTIAAEGGSHKLTAAEKESLAQQIIAAMLFGKPATPWFAQLVDIAVRLKADFDVPMPPTSKSANGGDLRKRAENGVAMAKTAVAIGKFAENLKQCKYDGGSEDGLRKSSDDLLERIANLKKQLGEAPAARTSAPPAPAAPANLVSIGKDANGVELFREATPRFQTLQTGERRGFQPQGDADPADDTTKRAPGGRFVPLQTGERR
jgi:hypothetical protein